jgi:hypothetical protein
MKITQTLLLSACMALADAKLLKAPRATITPSTETIDISDILDYPDPVMDNVIETVEPTTIEPALVDPVPEALPEPTVDPVAAKETEAEAKRKAEAEAYAKA